MANRSERDERRAKAEQMIKAQKAKEQRQSFLIIGIAVVVVIGLITAAAIPFLRSEREQARIDAVQLSSLGVSRSAASCDPVKKEDAAPNAGNHVPTGTPIQYPTAPPAAAQHWGNFLQGSEIRAFYTVDDRPELERMVHSLEHGHTILWYDDTVKPGTDSYRQLQQIAEKLPASNYFMAAPWTADDGEAFPDGKHIAMTHWTGPDNPQGISQYCAAPSGAVLETFMKDYPKENTPEPGAA